MDMKRIAWCCALAALISAGQNCAQAEPLSSSAKAAPPSKATVVTAERATDADIALVGQELRQAAQEKRKLTAADEKWLEVLRRFWGRDEITVPNLDKLPAQRTVKCRLSVDYINNHPNALTNLQMAWNAMEAATQLQGQIFQGDDYQVPCYNSDIYALLRPHYSQVSFGKLFALLRGHGAFDININPDNGLITTSAISGDENHEMACRQWVTDTVRTGELERVVAPLEWPKVLNTLATYYTSATEQRAFDRCINDPSIYREGGITEGVAHIFYPDTLQRDPGWFNNKRIESHGLALKALCEGIIGADNKDAWSVAEPSDAYVQSIANLAAYFMRIDYVTAPSAGNWEETPFPGGLTWSTDSIRSALQTLQSLLYDTHYDHSAVVLKFRHRLAQAKYGDIVFNRVNLAKAIASGEDRVWSDYMAESKGRREVDASLSFMAAGSFRLSLDSLESISKYLEQLQMLEDKLVREHGMLRYEPFYMQLKDGSKHISPDSYLTLNYNIACDPQGKLNLEWGGVLDGFGSKDCSEPLVFTARASLATPDREAEWFMVSDVARGYAHQARLVLQAAARRMGHNGSASVSELNAQEMALFKQAQDGAERNINRAYARVTAGAPMVKANGGTAAPWSVPEAWQSVSTLDGKVNYLPGINTPLTWASVSLWSASLEFMNLLEEAER